MTHEPLVSRELFGRVEGRARENENQSKAGVQPNAPAKRFRAGRFYAATSLSSAGCAQFVRAVRFPGGSHQAAPPR
jgi:hypothetical protein